MRSLKVFIQTPDYDHSSGGIRVLHYLGHLCMLLGHSVMMPCSKYFPEFIRPNGFDGEHDIFIIPEIYHTDNILIKNCMRWVLYYPGKICSGPLQYPDHEYVVSYSIDYLASAIEANSSKHSVPIFYLPYSDMSGADPKHDKFLKLFWIGKGDFVYHSDISNCDEITRKWPQTRKELIWLLNRTKTLYTYDKCSSLNEEAIMCGCEIKYFDGINFIPYVTTNFGRWYMNIEEDKILVADFLEHLKAIFGIL